MIRLRAHNRRVAASRGSGWGGRDGMAVRARGGNPDLAERVVDRVAAAPPRPAPVTRSSRGRAPRPNLLNPPPPPSVGQPVRRSRKCRPAGPAEAFDTAMRELLSALDAGCLDLAEQLLEAAGAAIEQLPVHLQVNRPVMYEAAWRRLDELIRAARGQ